MATAGFAVAVALFAAAFCFLPQVRIEVKIPVISFCLLATAAVLWRFRNTFKAVNPEEVAKSLDNRLNGGNRFLTLASLKPEDDLTSESLEFIENQLETKLTEQFGEADAKKLTQAVAEFFPIKLKKSSKVFLYIIAGLLAISITILIIRANYLDCTDNRYGNKACLNRNLSVYLEQLKKLLEDSSNLPEEVKKSATNLTSTIEESGLLSDETEEALNDLDEMIEEISNVPDFTPDIEKLKQTLENIKQDIEKSKEEEQKQQNSEESQQNQQNQQQKQTGGGSKEEQNSGGQSKPQGGNNSGENKQDTSGSGSDGDKNKEQQSKQNSGDQNQSGKNEGDKNQDGQKGPDNSDGSSENQDDKNSGDEQDSGEPQDGQNQDGDKQGNKPSPDKDAAQDKANDSKNDGDQDGSPNEGQDGTKRSTNMKDGSETNKQADKEGDESQPHETPAQPKQEQPLGRPKKHAYKLPQPSDTAPRFSDEAGGGDNLSLKDKNLTGVEVQQGEQQILGNIGKEEDKRYLNKKETATKMILQDGDFEKSDSNVTREKQPIPVEYQGFM